VLTGLPSAQDATVRGTSATFRTTDPAAAVTALLGALRTHGVELIELHVQKASLEEVFVQLTSGGAAEDAR
jgi:hypothetical protein